MLRMMMFVASVTVSAAAMPAAAYIQQGTQSAADQERLNLVREQHDRQVVSRAPQLASQNEAHKLLEKVRSDPQI